MALASIAAGIKFGTIILTDLLIIKKALLKAQKIIKKDPDIIKALRCIRTSIKEAAVRVKKAVLSKVTRRPRTRNVIMSRLGDIKPQTLTMKTGVAGDLDVYTTAQIVLPVPRFGIPTLRSMLFELLWIDWYLAFENSIDLTTSHWAWLSIEPTRKSGETSTLLTAAVDVADPCAFGFVMKSVLVGGAGGAEIKTNPTHIDFTDNNGHGILLAANRIQITGGSTFNNNAPSFIAKVGYRLVNVGLREYVGIVCIQQST